MSYFPPKIPLKWSKDKRAGRQVFIVGSQLIFIKKVKKIEYTTKTKKKLTKHSIAWYDYHLPWRLTKIKLFAPKRCLLCENFVLIINKNYHIRVLLSLSMESLLIFTLGSHTVPLNFYFHQYLNCCCLCNIFKNRLDLNLFYQHSYLS